MVSSAAYWDFLIALLPSHHAVPSAPRLLQIHPRNRPAVDDPNWGHKALSRLCWKLTREGTFCWLTAFVKKNFVKNQSVQNLLCPPQVPELAGFWLLSLLLQFPLILFQLFNESILVQPLERGVHIVLSLFILTEVIRHLLFFVLSLSAHNIPSWSYSELMFLYFCPFSVQALSGFVALREMVHHTENHFHLQQFAGVQELKTWPGSIKCGERMSTVSYKIVHGKPL